jgi:transcriptional regulator with XRE-family HTH domain
VEAATAFRRLRAALREALAEADLSHREASERLGHHPGYLSRALTGHLDLKVREALELLELLGIDPGEFFPFVFPFGGNPMAALLRAPRPADVPALPDAGALLREALAARGESPPTPAQLTARAGELLRMAIRRAGSSQREVSRALGLSPDALGLALRGNTRLSFHHLFGTLAATGVDPGRFFIELFVAAAEPLAARVSWRQLLDRLEEAFGEGARGLARKGREPGRRRR